MIVPLFGTSILVIMGDHSTSRKLQLSFFFFIFTLPFLLAQPGIEWDLTVGGGTWEEANRIIQTIDGNGFIVGGYTSSEGTGLVSGTNRGWGDFWIFTTDLDGNKLWDKRYGGDGIDRIWWIMATSSGNYLLVGESNSNIGGEKSEACYGLEDFWVVMVDAQGNFLWDRTYGGSGTETPFCAQETAEGDFIITGWSGSPADGNKLAPNYGDWDIWTIKIDAQGNKLWDKTYGGEGNEQVQYLFPAGDGNYLIGGTSNSDAGAIKTDTCRGLLDYWLIKIDTDGNKLWDKTFGGNEHDILVSIAPGINGTFWLAGGSASSFSGEKSSQCWGGEDFWMVQVDSSGNFMQDATFGSGGLDKVYAFYQNPLGNIMAAGLSATTSNEFGNVEAGRGGFDYWAVFLKPDGNQIWNKKFGSTDNDALTDFVFIPNEGFVLLGNSMSNIGYEKSENSYGMNDAWMIKLLCDFDVALGEDTIVCPNSEVIVSANATNCENCGFIWSNNKVGEQVTFDVTGDLEVYVTAISENACEFTDTIMLLASAGPEVAQFAVEPPSCVGFNDGTIQLENVIGGKPPYLLLEDTLDLGNLLVWQRAGPQWLHISDSLGCMLDTLLTIPAPVPFTVDLGPDTVIWLGDAVTINAYTNQPIATFEWLDPTLLTVNPEVSPVQTTEYIISVVSTKGCIAQGERRITVRDRKDFFAPTVFSPDHDGYNDYFIIFGGRGVAEIRNMQMFDRWGSLLFQLPKVWPAEQENGWSGDIRGDLAPVGVYVWQAELVLLDGSVEIIYGDVTLLR